MADIEINHTRTEGTILTGSTKGDGVYEIVKHHNFRSSRHVTGLYIRGSRDKEASWRINAAAAALREAGHTVTIEIDDEDPRTFAEIEAERRESAEERADRFADRASRATASADARREAADQISKRFEFGQPILVGHHSERRARRDADRIDTNMRRSVEERDRASYWANRTGAAENYEQHRNDPHRTLRRLKKLGADLRALERDRAEVVERGWEPSEQRERRIRELTEEIAHWEALVEKAVAEGVKVWGPGDFAPGDFVRYLDSYYQVVRVNPATLSVAWNLRYAPKPVMTLDDATEGGRVGTHTADYTQVQWRCPEEAMYAWLADCKVPGKKLADEASDKAPAAAIRNARAAAKKATPKKRTDPKIPKGVRVEAQWRAPEATLTWLNGRNQPHRDHPPVTLTAAEGTTYTESVWSEQLGTQVNQVLAEAGYMPAGTGWRGGPANGLSGAIVPVPKEEPKAVAEQPAPELAIEEEPAATPAEEPAIEKEAQVEEDPAVQGEPAVQEPEQPKVWGRGDFERGDYVQALGGWHKVLRSNPRSVSVPGPEVYLIQWDMVTGRRSAEEMADVEKVALTCDSSGTTRNRMVDTRVGHSDQPLTPSISQEPAMPVTTTEVATEVAAPAPDKEAAPKRAPRAKKTADGKAPAKKVAEPAKVSKRREVAADQVAEAKAKAATQKTIPIDRIDRDPTQPREHFDQAKLDELAKSMRKLGQLQPITVVYITATKRYRLIMGERRWRAAKAAGLTEMTALVLHGVHNDPRTTLAMATAENVGRVDMTPVEEAKAFKRLEGAKFSIDEIAEMVGKSPAYVGWRIDLLRLCDSAREALEKGHLTVGLAWYVSLLNTGNQMRFLARHARGEFRSTREAEAFAQAARDEEKRQEEQGSFFVLAEESPEAPGDDRQEALPGSLDVPEGERERIAAERSKLTKKIDKLGDLGAILSELATANPEELALLLAGTPGGVPGHMLRIEHLREVALRATKTLRQAQAIAAIRADGIRLNPEAVTEAAEPEAV
ncbi:MULTISPECIES: ParB/RepB/Spo0J family partition protein [unclassified Streptomyces]|uniref:ParB/RepB/Spo0J family partition protein n=1 Tax=unclassified Streptomyces TaxID=2593676 RepID=UPI0009A0C256|nr:ParB/RepB/Spo0J family partition protein [Streptomyces sp. TSRI0281]